MQNIENGFNVIKSQGSWAKEFYEYSNFSFSHTNITENINSKRYSFEFLKSDNYFQFIIYWDTGFEIKSPFLDTLVVDTNYQDLCDNITIKPTNGTFKKLFYLKQKGIISFVDYEEKTWKLEE